MPHATEHTPKVSTQLINPYARESSREKRQQDGRTDRRIVQNHFYRRFEGFISQIRSYLEVDFLHDANTSIDMEVKSLYRGEQHLWHTSFFIFRFNYAHSTHLSCTE